MANAKKKVKKAKIKPSRRSIIFASLAGVLLLVVGGYWLRSYLTEKQALAELSTAGKELRIVYNNILELNKDNIENSHFQDDCSVSNASWLEQKISCGPSGNVELKTPIDLEEAAELVADSIQGNGLGLRVEDIVTGQNSVGVSTGVNEAGIKCYVGYSQNSLTDAWSYGLVCRKTVPNFLPGYTVEE